MLYQMVQKIASFNSKIVSRLLVQKPKKTGNSKKKVALRAVFLKNHGCSLGVKCTSSKFAIRVFG